MREAMAPSMTISSHLQRRGLPIPPPIGKCKCGTGAPTVPTRARRGGTAWTTAWVCASASSASATGAPSTSGRCSSLDPRSTGRRDRPAARPDREPARAPSRRSRASPTWRRRSTSIDAVVIATPPSTHAPLALRRSRPASTSWWRSRSPPRVDGRRRDASTRPPSAGSRSWSGHTFEYHAAVWTLRDMVHARRPRRPLLRRHRPAEPRASTSTTSTCLATSRRTTSRS